MSTTQSENKPHITPLKTYLGVAAALMVLTVITVAVSFIDLGGFNIVIALIIASIKATLVGFFFMHLYYDNKTYMIVLATALAFLTLFISLTMFDTLRRDDVYDIESHPIQKEAIIYQKNK